MKKTALITGASRGIGKAIARALASDGYHLALFCHSNIEMLRDLAQELTEEYKVEVYTYCGNIADFEFTVTSCEDALDKLGRIDVLINNAGKASIGLLTDMTAMDWNSMLGTNLSSLFYTAKAIVPSMIRHKSGNIINISSMWGSVGASCEVAYSATKGGMNAFTKALAKELAPNGVAVNAIACGVVDTDMNGMLSPEEKAELAEEIPVGKFCTPDEIAEVVLGIIKAPSYMTGQIIGVDGGYI
ncbi:elongation factor P 5-aminopentanone reductase [Pseudobutyrivibrio xylanivorans]|uniref:SDR family NAD(P)-dependent oxidoreductase n=1 Tax=Pseudobutyrivibrio xylanivorans TaxID=185007 RepID=A0A5P6VUD7_PSEXY|nr:SDR family NAD(P)-dependent oxidoreductase [Pseudobutyrivibrio xylanivorans]QFJ54834.1 SDR family NAD(P)-dependent oxidoreductase [Pseudobutyrivibrio xylanivorans]